MSSLLGTKLRKRHVVRGVTKRGQELVARTVVVKRVVKRGVARLVVVANQVQTKGFNSVSIPKQS